MGFGGFLCSFFDNISWHPGLGISEALVFWEAFQFTIAASSRHGYCSFKREP